MNANNRKWVTHSPQPTMAIRLGAYLPRPLHPFPRRISRNTGIRVSTIGVMSVICNPSPKHATNLHSLSLHLSLSLSTNIRFEILAKKIRERGWMEGEATFRLVRLLFHLAVKDLVRAGYTHIWEDRCLSRDRRIFTAEFRSLPKRDRYRRHGCAIDQPARRFPRHVQGWGS